MTSADTNARLKDLGWPYSLGFKLGLIALLLVGLVGAGLYFGTRTLLGSELQADILRYEENAAQQVAGDLGSLMLRMEMAADTLARLALSGSAAARPSLLQGQSLEPMIAAMGIWYEPRSVDPARERYSLYWVRGAQQFEVREGYNDPRAVPYFREPWYTPARYGAPRRCYWTPPYQEPIAKAELVSCVMPMLLEGRFVGVVTLSISVPQLNQQIEKLTARLSGYSLLVDGGGQFIGGSGKALAVVDQGGRPRNFAELAQRQAAFNRAALDLHELSEAGEATDAKRAAELKSATRDFAQADAERVLKQLKAAQTRTQGDIRHLNWSGDPILSGGATATLTPLPGASWQLLRVLPAGAGVTGTQTILDQTLLLALSAAAALVLLVLMLLRFTLLAPLREIIRQIAAARAPDLALKLTLNEAPRNELGALAQAINERSRGARELVDQSHASSLQLSLEAKDRRAQAEQLARTQERAALAMQAVGDAVISVDEQGSVEELNAAAEALLGTTLVAVRGLPLSDAVHGRAANSELTLAQLVSNTMTSGERATPVEEFRLAGSGGTLRTVQAVVAPLKARGSKAAGAVLVLHEKAAQAGAEVKRGANLTGLPGRAACEKRIAKLIESSKLGKRRDAALVVGIDQLRRLNEVAGRETGDDAIRKLGEVLHSKIGGMGEVFHLYADLFAVLLGNSDAQRARTFADALRETVSKVRFSGTRSMAITVSIGIAEFGSEAKANEVLPRAEDACNAARTGGRNQIKIYDSSMNRPAAGLDDGVWVRRIRAGLERNMFRLTTQFVSPTSLANGDGQIFESLLSLEDEEGFWSDLSSFMPVAEQQGLAVAVDRWHISHVAQQLVQSGDTMNRVGLVTIPLSQSSIFDPDLPDFLIELVEKHPELRGRLCLDISEANMAAYPQQAQNLAEVLRGIGIKLSIGDFLGRDPRVLSQLRNIPADFVRLNAHYFHNIGGDGIEQRFADSTLQLARGLKKRTWVCGLDDPGQLDIWRRLNAEHYQGAAIARATPVLFQTPR